VGGKGFERLRAAGVELELAEGELERRARRQNAAFRVHAVLGRPFVLLKLAASLDGRTATASGESRWISSAESRRLVHAWRASMDAVAIGSGTALADDPALDARDLDPPAERQPLRVVFDRRARLHEGLRLASGGTLQVAPAGAAPPPGGVERIEADDPAQALRALGARGVTSVLVEGGAELASGLLRAGLIDALGLLGSLGVGALGEAPRLHDLRSRPVGPDVLLEAELRKLP
jgi:diaminohydroxyphosphoribosylaminopyrimidine deaminase/5-amino-6-(5-phosphoribosylamino)uracil reductase